ncbi:MAG: AAA family ATPase [Bryobacteraceae bacterium]|nr:AAA family ATPase [Bryobacteraceae bacterium]
MDPKLILFAGSACSWKTTIAAKLSARTGIPHLSMDHVRVRLIPGPRHTRAERLIALRAMNLAAELLLASGASVILDAQYRSSEDRQEAAAAAEKTGARLALIECMVSPDEAVRRFVRRGPDPVRLNLTPELVRQMARDFVYTREGLLLDTDALTPEECLARVESFLAGRGSSPADAARSG